MQSHCLSHCHPLAIPAASTPHPINQSKFPIIQEILTKIDFQNFAGTQLFLVYISGEHIIEARSLKSLKTFFLKNNLPNRLFLIPPTLTCRQVIS